MFIGGMDMRLRSYAPGAGPLFGFFTSFWKLDDLADAIGSNTLTNSGSVSFVPGKIGNCASFPVGANQSLSFASNPSVSMGTGSFTIVAWVNVNTSTATRGIVRKGTDYILDFETSSSSWRFQVSSGIATVSTTDGNTNGSFHLVIADWNSGLGQASIQVDNGVIHTVTATIGNINTSAGFVIGAYTAGGAFGMYGLIDAVGISKGGLLAAGQRTALWNNSNGVEPPF